MKLDKDLTNDDLMHDIIRRYTFVPCHAHVLVKLAGYQIGKWSPAEGYTYDDGPLVTGSEIETLSRKCSEIHVRYLAQQDRDKS